MKYYTSDIMEEIRNENISDNLNESFKMIETYANNVDNYRVFPKEEDLNYLKNISDNYNTLPISTEDILSELNILLDKGAVSSTGSRYFGFVIGGILPAALHTRLVSDILDQNTGLYMMSPLSSKLEDLCEKWMLEILKLPKECAMGIVTGSATATILALNAAMHKINPTNREEIKVVLSEQAHATVYKSLKILGISNKKMIRVPADSQGRIIADSLPSLDSNSILILQAGNVNTGAYDDFEKICTLANKQNCWVHIDGAFGLYANSCKELEHLTKGIELADSWTVDAHKTLNSPYDNGLVICKHKDIYLNSLKAEGAYLVDTGNRDGMNYTTEMSRRARSIELWATLKSLGKEGISELVYELYQKALYFSDKLIENDFEVLNDVVFNQVLVHLKDDNTTKELLRLVNESGICFMSSSTYNNKFVIRISVSSYKTTYKDIDLCLKKYIELKEMLLNK